MEDIPVKKLNKVNFCAMSKVDSNISSELTNSSNFWLYFFL